MIGALFVQYHNYMALAQGTDDVAAQAEMMAMELERDIRERLNAILAPEGVTVDMIGKVFP